MTQSKGSERRWFESINGCRQLLADLRPALTRQTRQELIGCGERGISYSIANEAVNNISKSVLRMRLSGLDRLPDAPESSRFATKQKLVSFFDAI